MNGAAIIVGNYESPQRGGDFRRDFSGPSRRAMGGRARVREGCLLTCFSSFIFLSSLASFPL